MNKLYSIDDVYTPRGPIDRPELLVGRDRELLLLEDVFNQKGATAVVIGARGVGKTSLALQSLRNSQRLAYIVCSSKSNFDSLARRLLKDLGIEVYNVEESKEIGADVRGGWRFITEIRSTVKGKKKVTKVALGKLEIDWPLF